MTEESIRSPSQKAVGGTVRQKLCSSAPGSLPGLTASSWKHFLRNLLALGVCDLGLLHILPLLGECRLRTSSLFGVWGLGQHFAHHGFWSLNLEKIMTQCCEDQELKRGLGQSQTRK